MLLRAAAALAALLLPAPGRGQTICPAPDALCTGDPCVTRATAIGTPCDLDFGSRALVIANGLTVPAGGAVTFRAGTITVQGGLNGRSPNGASVTLIATGDVLQQGLVDVSGTQAAGAITIVAGGTVTLAGKLKASGGTTAAGGLITVDAGGRVFGPMTISNDVHGAHDKPAGSAVYRGVAGVDMIGHLFLRSGFGGYAEFSSTAGPVSIGTDIRTRNFLGVGPMLVLRAATDATVARGMSADGRTGGGVIMVSGATVTMPKHQGLHARGRGGPGGTVVVRGGTILANETLGTDGYTSGGVIDVSGDRVTLNAGVTALGKSAGGHISLVATAGDLLMQPSVSAVGGSGVVVAHASANLVARGTVQVAPGGCIALSAGGVVDTSAVVLDVPLSPGCP